MTRRFAPLILVIAALVVLGAVAPGHASGRWRGGVFVGVGPWWGSPYWGPAYPYWWYPPPYYYPPTVIVEEPKVYIERPPAAPPPPPAPPADWYYCRSGQAYYPSVQTCPEDWVKVPARP
jgi:hypothetical protein